MKKFFFTLMTCAALASVALAGGKTDEGAAFVGEWRDKGSETITVSKVNGGYRAVSKLDDPDMSFFDMEVKLVAESDQLLVTADKEAQALELSADGTLTSHMRNKTNTFTKVK